MWSRRRLSANSVRRALAAVLLAAALVSVARAQEAGEEPPSATSSGAVEERYGAARRALEERRAAEASAKIERDRLANEAQSLRIRLIATAERVQTLEVELEDIASKLVTMENDDKRLSASFAADRETVAKLLAVLQRLEGDAPPALVMHADDSLAAARGAMLLGAFLPTLYDRAAKLALRLRALRDARAALIEKRREASQTAQALEGARADLEALLDERHRQAEEAGRQYEEVHALSTAAAREAGDLKSLLERIAALRRQDSGRTVTVVGPKTTSRAVPPKRGALLRPVIGTSRPGGPIMAGGTRSPGLEFSAKSGAQVVAPADSEVVFAGPYHNFANVLILEIGGGYHILLAGLGRLDVGTGDVLLAGEPVGIMPDTQTAALYLELHLAGGPIDPTPWMAAELRKAKGT